MAKMQVEIKSGQSSHFKTGPSSLAVTNITPGGGDGSESATYKITMGDGQSQKQTLEGAGSMQQYFNLVYPITIKNKGPDPIQVT